MDNMKLTIRYYAATMPYTLSTNTFTAILAFDCTSKAYIVCAFFMESVAPSYLLHLKLFN